MEIRQLQGEIFFPYKAAITVGNNSAKPVKAWVAIAAIVSGGFAALIKPIIAKITMKIFPTKVCSLRVHRVIAGGYPFTAKVLEKGKSLKIVAKWGIGIDAIDLKVAERLGIPAKNTRDVFVEEVGDVALGYIILLAGQLHKMDLSGSRWWLAANTRYDSGG